MAELTCLSWNIHRGRGGDGRVDPDRVMAVLATEVFAPGTEALFLQEADAEAFPHTGVLDVARIETVTGLRHVQTARETRSTVQSHGVLGVVTFLHPRWEIEAVRVLDLPGIHPRGAVIVEAGAGGQKLWLINTHLSLAQLLRVAQMRVIGQYLQRNDRRPTILAGDFNEWRPWGGLAFSRLVLTERFHGPARRSFPVTRPLLPLDRILVSPPGRVALTVLDGSGIRAASDHRPIRGEVTF